MKAVVLLSGGMDSCTVAAHAKENYAAVRAVFFTYGSKHQEAELKAAKSVYQALGLDGWDQIDLPRIFGGSALTDGDPLPLGRDLQANQGVAPSYVPARNTVFLALAAAVAEAWDAKVICFGAHREDHVGYPDTRPEYAQAMSNAIRLGTTNGITVEAPFVRQEKVDIVRAARRLSAPLHLTHSCYQGLVPACGVCDTCQIRIQAFQQAGYIDPIPYAVDVRWTGCKPFRSS